MTTEATLGRLVMEAVSECDRLRQAGASIEDVQRGLENLIRDRWPFVREWHYICSSCNDCGLVMVSEVNKLGTRVETGYPCSCPKGNRFRPKVRTEDDAVAAAARAKKAPSRFGR